MNEELKISVDNINNLLENLEKRNENINNILNEQTSFLFHTEDYYKGQRRVLEDVIFMLKIYSKNKDNKDIFINKILELYNKLDEIFLITNGMCEGEIEDNRETNHTLNDLNIQRDEWDKTIEEFMKTIEEFNK